MQFVEIKAAEHTTQAAMVVPTAAADTVVIKRISEKTKKGPIKQDSQE